MQLTYFGHACFLANINGIHVLFDPFITGNPLAKDIDINALQVDYILLSHGHGDHVADFEVIARRTGAKLLAIAEIASHYGAKGFESIGANLGGTLYNNANIMRGIYEQRFRDRQMMAAQAELRQHLFWRIDGAAFLGFGQVGQSVGDYTFKGIHTTGGLGARFNFIRRDRVNLRFDYAFGTDPGFYFAIGEAF